MRTALDRLALIGALCSATPLVLSCTSPQVLPPLDPLVEAIVYTRLSPSNWDVYLFEEAGALPRRLTDDPSLDYNAVFSPDGRWVVFTSERTGNADLYALDLEAGGAPVRLTESPAMDDAASISPDGERLAFVSTRDGDADIFLMPFSPRDATAEQRALNLTRRAGGDFNPSFSPDGRQIAFSRQSHLWHEDDICWHVELCVMNADGSNLRAFKGPGDVPPDADYSEEVAGSPAWSADGETLYYYYVYRYYRESGEGDAEGVVGRGEVRRVHRDGSEDVPVVSRAYSPAVAPGGRIGFVRPEDGDDPPRYTSGRIFTVAADGSDPRAESPSLEQCFAPHFEVGSGRLVCHGPGPPPPVGPELTRGRSFAKPGGHRRVELPDRAVVLRATGGYFPALTPDGEVLSTLRIRSSGEARTGQLDGRTEPLHLSTIEGARMREAFRPPSGIAWGVNVAREAGWAVVAVGPTFGGSDEDVDVWKVRLDGSEAVNLTSDSPANDALPSISSDGRRIAFRSGRDGARDTTRDPPIDMAVYVMDGNGENPRRLTDAAARETMPAMSPDGEWVVYVAFQGYAAKLWLSRVDGSERRILEPERAHIPDKSMHPRFSPDGRWVVFTSDRGGMNDEWPLTLAPQPYGDLWVVSADGGPAIRLTADKWEDGPNDWGYLRLTDSRPD